MDNNKILERLNELSVAIGLNKATLHADSGVKPVEFLLNDIYHITLTAYATRYIIESVIKKEIGNILKLELTGDLGTTTRVTFIDLNENKHYGEIECYKWYKDGAIAFEYMNKIFFDSEFIKKEKIVFTLLGKK